MKTEHTMTGCLLPPPTTVTSTCCSKDRNIDMCFNIYACTLAHIISRDYSQTKPRCIGEFNEGISGGQCPPQTHPQKVPGEASGASRMQENLLEAGALPLTPLREFTMLPRPSNLWGRGGLLTPQEPYPPAVLAFGPWASALRASLLTQVPKIRGVAPKMMGWIRLCPDGTWYSTQSTKTYWWCSWEHQTSACMVCWSLALLDQLTAHTHTHTHTQLEQLLIITHQY